MCPIWGGVNRRLFQLRQRLRFGFLWRGSAESLGDVLAGELIGAH